MLSIAETTERLEAAISEAREFFAIEPAAEFELFPILDGNGAAAIDVDDGYLHYGVKVSLQYYRECPHLIRRDMAHEIAHLLSKEILQLKKRMPEEWRDDDAPQGGLLSDAVETLTCRLGYLFLRERPVEEPTP